MKTNESDQTWRVSVDEEGILQLPDELLTTLGWKENDLLEWVEENDGSIILRKYEDNGDGDESEFPTSKVNVQSD